MENFEPFHGCYPASLISWVNERGWPRFREIQQKAIATIPIGLDQPIPDLILEAETSSGKTEAAFLPLIARLMARPISNRGFSLLYISPLRALINDQLPRIMPLAELAGIQAHAWHADVPQGDKNKIRAAGKGILLTTPESLEAFAIGAATDESLFHALSRVECIVVDEVHSFFDTARGKHLQSLLHRLDGYADRAIPRLGLSATLGSADVSAAAVLRPELPAGVAIVRSTGDEARPAQVRLRAFVDDDASRIDGETPNDRMIERIARQLVSDFAEDSRGLVFANSRGAVTHLTEKCQELSGPDGIQFFEHHSSILAPDRRRREKWMRGEGDDAPSQMVVIATNTLELGIDIGKVARVVQIDPTFTVSALRQRIGRSGRRNDESPNGLLYLREQRTTEASHPLDRLRLRTFQAAATAQLAMEGEFERPHPSDLHLSALYHQIISTLREKTFATAEELYSALVETGPWNANLTVIDKSFFDRLLETMSGGRDPAIERIDEISWKLTEARAKRRHTYAMFSTPPEYIVSAGGNVVGKLPMTVAYRVGDTFVLNRGRWRVVDVNDERRTLTVVRAPTAGAPRFGGLAQVPSGIVSQMMLEIYKGRDVSGLAADDDFMQLIAEGRTAFEAYDLRNVRLLQAGRDVILFPWRGARALQTLMLAMRREGLRASASNFAILVEDATLSDVVAMLKMLKGLPLPELDELAREARQLRSDRFDRHLIPYHQRLAFASRHLSREGLFELIDDLLAATPTPNS
ncbi:DEAD/DEAH box helicase [Mesorhizobium sp.]|uniref:DEAD/DEAH box helicase n=1 Tax=Mesorhizobium sp. TaxID=1871066 RepID=UPI000FE8D457|nr:DEAD/DEAH box helicase [Mesorhizobium sp.]RWJ43115.1 MAG: DEAD/DEAH box helicase [Mesorhizobium sp.]